MGCARCGHANPAGSLHCQSCGHRLFAWLGDPFGNLDPPAHPAASGTTAAITARSVATTSWGRWVTASVVVLLSYPFDETHGLWTLAGAVLLAVTLWRRPRVDWLVFLVLLVLAAVWPLAAAIRSLEPAPPARAAVTTAAQPSQPQALPANRRTP